MGFNIITIDIVPEEVQYLYINGIWKFEGISNVSIKNIEKSMRKIKLKRIGQNYYTNKQNIDLRIIEKENRLLAIRVEGTVSSIDYMLKSCYDVAIYFSRSFKLRFCVLGNSINLGQYENYVNSVKKIYKQKIDFNETCHMNDFKYVVPPHKFDKIYKKYCKKIRLFIF